MEVGGRENNVGEKVDEKKEKGKEEQGKLDAIRKRWGGGKYYRQRGERGKKAAEGEKR